LGRDHRELGGAIHPAHPYAFEDLIRLDRDLRSDLHGQLLGPVVLQAVGA
jgi:hypothetical protein